MDMVAPSSGNSLVLIIYKKYLFLHFTAQIGYEKKAKGLIRVIQSQKFTIHFAKLGFFANENFTVLRGNKH